MNAQIIAKHAGNFVVKHTRVFRKYAPEILTGVAAVGTIGGTVLACRATLHVSPVIDSARERIADIHKATEEGATATGKEYSEADSRKDLARVYAETGIEVLKLYAPAVGILGLSLASMLGSSVISRKRNVALAAAYAAIDQGFKDYRAHVIERFGSEVDKQLKYNIKAERVNETVTDDEGNQKKVKKTVDVVEKGVRYSDYARIFDEFNPEWKDNPERNLCFLNCQQRYANNRLKERGFLTLNEVYEMLGFEPSDAGVHVGWIYKPDNERGDNYVDFGIFNVNSPAARDFVNGYEPAIVLDFNVDGYLYSIQK